MPETPEIPDFTILKFIGLTFGNAYVSQLLTDAVFTPRVNNSLPPPDIGIEIVPFIMLFVLEIVIYDYYTHS